MQQTFPRACQKANPTQISTELLMILIGCIIYALSVVLISPITVIPGSAIGVAVVCNMLFQIPTGTVNLLINIPLIMMGTKLLGKKILIYTALTLLGTSLLIDFFSPYGIFVPAWAPIILAVLGGLSMGLGAGILLRAGATMGGTTIIARLLQRRHPALRVGNALLVMDGMIVIAGAILVRDLIGFLYSLIYMFLCNKTIDLILYGIHRPKP